MNERVTEIRKAKGLNQTDFAQKIGITQASLSLIELGKSKLTEANIRLICLSFGVREEWLREGKGEMMDEEAQLSDYEKRLLELFRRLSPGAQKAFLEYVEKLVALATDDAVLCGEALEALKQAPGGTTQPPEALQEAKGEEETTETTVNPIHNKDRG
jgi:transcriptional regulator with XRE-family HTH domain